MITMTKLPHIPSFSKIVKNQYISDPIKAVRPIYNDLGYIIFNVFKNFKEISPSISISQYVIMPDHIHFIVQIKENLERPLEHYMDCFQQEVVYKAKDNNILSIGQFDVFEFGFNDQFLTTRRKLDVLFQYIKRNPHDLWVRWENPEWYRRVSIESVLGVGCSLYGNPELLMNPFIYPVVVHRSDINNPEVLKRKFKVWEYCIFNGGVIAGAFINSYEKKIRDLAFANGSPIILMSNRAYGEKEKPSKFMFEYCEGGKLLVVSPDMYAAYREMQRRPNVWMEEEDYKNMMERGWQFRHECIAMNRIMEELGKNNYMPKAGKNDC